MMIRNTTSISGGGVRVVCVLVASIILTGCPKNGNKEAAESDAREDVKREIREALAGMK